MNKEEKFKEDCVKFVKHIYEHSGLKLNIDESNLVDWVMCKICNKTFAEITKPKTYKIGQRFKYKNYDTYLLSSVDYKKCALINIKSGCRWDDAKKVSDRCNITEEEMQKIIDNKLKDFELIE